MSFVTTARLSSLPSSRQSSAISELLPVPTGPATPIRRARVGVFSGTEQPPLAGSVELAPLLDEGGAVGRDVVGRAGRRDPGNQGLDRDGRVGRPAHALGGVERFELEGGGDD